MLDYRTPWRRRVADALNTLFRNEGLETVLEASQVAVEAPPRPELGDLAFPMFAYAKLLRKGPPRIAQTLRELLAAECSGGAFNAEGPYLNLRLNRGDTAAQILTAVFEGTRTGDFPFGRPGTLDGKRIMVEFSSPNTNKPLHL